MTAPAVFKVDGVDVSATVTPDWALSQSADKGTTASSGFNLDDGSAAITLPALKDTTVEFGAATPVRAYTGYTTDRTQARNPDATMGPASTDRRFQVNVTDLNALLSDRILHGSGGKRPAETDIERITWLLSSPYLAGLVFDNGFIDTANPVPQEETDFGGQYAYDVLVKCSESSGKNMFVDWDPGAGQATLNYRIDATSASRSSDVLISNHAADIDNVNVFAPDPASNLNLDPQAVYSGIYYQGANGINAYVRSGANERNFRQREISISDSQVKTTATAIRLARAYLDRIAVEAAQITVTIKLAIADANRVAAGMRIQVKFTHLTGYTSYQWINVNKCTKRPADETQQHIYLDLVLLNLINTGFHGGTTPPGTSNPAPGPPISPTPPFPIPPSGITDSFNRPDDLTELGTSDSGRIWGTISGTPEIISDQGAIPAVGGAAAELPGPWPVPFHGSIILAGVTIPVLPAYVEASDWGPSWESSSGTASVNGTSAFEDGDSVMLTFVPIIDPTEGGFSIALDFTPNSPSGSPDLIWRAVAMGLSFIIEAHPGVFSTQDSPGGPTTNWGTNRAWFYIQFQIDVTGGGVFTVSSTPIDFDSYAHFLANGVSGTVDAFITAADIAEMDFLSSSTTVTTSPYGTPSFIGDVDLLAVGGVGSSGAPTDFDANFTLIVPIVTDFGWYWQVDGLATDGTTPLHYTAGYASTGHAPIVGGWDPGFPPVYEVPTPLLYVEIRDDSGNVTRGWARLPGDLAMPQTPIVDIVPSGITLTMGGTFASALNSGASLPALGSLNGPLIHSLSSGLGSDFTFDDLNVTGVSAGGTTLPSGPVQASTVPLSIDATGVTDVSVTLSDWINAQPAGSVIYLPPTATYQAALKLHGLLNVEIAGQGATIQAPPGGYTEDFSTIYLQSFGGSNENIQIHDLHLIGTSPTPGVFISGHEGQHGILADGSINVEIWNIVCEAMYGDFLEVNSGATLIHAHDFSVPNTGRNGLSVIFGNNVEFGPGIDLGTMGYMPFDIEPNDASETCHDIRIHDGDTAAWSNLFFATDGSATGAAIYNIEVVNIVSTGFSLATEVNPAGTARETNITFSGNSSNVSAAGPVLQFKDVDTLYVQHNTQALSSGSLVSATTCTDTHIGPNP